MYFSRILACCTYYFPTTMALMYCYGSGFHVSKTKSKCSQDPRSNGMPVSCAKSNLNELETIVSKSYKYFRFSNVLIF